MLEIKWVGEMTESIFSPLTYSLDLKGLLLIFSPSPEFAGLIFW